MQNADRPFSILIFRRYSHDRYRKAAVTGKAPFGGSTGSKPVEGTQGPDTAADSGRCDIGESITASNPNDIGTVGGIFMGSIQSSTMILCALGNRSASFLSRRAHLLTTSSEQTPYPSLRPGRGRAHSLRCSSSPHKALRLCVAPFGGGIPDGPCALRGGCGFCGSLRTMRSAMLSSAQLAGAGQESPC